MTNQYHTTVCKEIEECVQLLIDKAFEPVVLQAGASNATEKRVDELLALAERISNIRKHLSGHEQMPHYNL